MPLLAGCAASSPQLSVSLLRCDHLNPAAPPPAPTVGSAAVRGYPQVCDRGIVDRLVAQTVLQPGVATVLARWGGVEKTTELWGAVAAARVEVPP